MKIPMFITAPDVQDEMAYEERRVVSREELSLNRRKKPWFNSRQDFLEPVPRPSIGRGEKGSD